ncbi:SDR family oxidoreductase [Gordonia jinghuaiqii]|uniref:SDR family oxidoreductase n=1 Tax=Gordonia jinghuaiqii TaxID=2758710 RepID=A0A7D7R2H4_9ACTN|nr:SDR family oxidoreductase [Gordonia jinghuaiqii]MCR5978333.1 SDR family oxidoreductase [Gordonia jinghuaiqii]QMT01232.1 SDR family oxidoreductase [Gordonia jinghuaiqii]
MSEQAVRQRSDRQPDWRRGNVINDGVRLATFELGDSSNPTVLLVHGWPDTHHLWTHVAPRLAEKYHVVAYDCRGFGESDRPRRTGAYRLDELADDLFAVAEAVSPDRAVHVVGHDWGSIHTWEAVSRPRAQTRIASFVSVSGPNLDHLGQLLREQIASPTPRHLRNIAAQSLSSSYTGLFQLPLIPNVALRALGNPRAWKQFLRTVEGTPPENVVVADSLRRDMITGLALYRANIRQKLLRPNPRITNVPVLQVVNERDVALRPAIYENTPTYAAKLWRRDTPTGHWLPYTHPDYLTDLVLDFLAVQTNSGAPAPTIDRSRLFSDPKPLAGKLVVITGAGSGIGRETALALAARGCELVLADLDAETADETARECKIAGATAHAHRLDVSDTAGFTEFADKVRTTHGVPDIVVNNAGIGLAGGALAATDEQVDRLLDVNLRGVITGSRAFGRQMVERGVGGHIVNISSAAAFTPSRSLGLYSASKAGVLLFSESLRAELAEHHIGVSVICPGLVDTNIVSSTPIAGLDADDERARRERLDRFYQRRGFTPDRVASEIVSAIEGNKAVVPVTIEAKVGYRIYRFAPWLSRIGARQKVTG